MKKEELIALVKKEEQGNFKSLIEFLKGDSTEKSNIDSLTFIEFVVMIEEEKEIEFEDDKLSLSNFENIQELIDYINHLEEVK